MSVTTRTKTAIPIPVDDRNGVVWNRFWLGVSAVLAFAIASTLLVMAIAGPKAGADYGLSMLVITLAATLVDGVILFRRRNR
jgi:hypothetical protein